MPDDFRLSSLDLLTVFESAARQLSFTAAANELGATQPAVSQQIKRLEKELGVRLFDRVYRGIELTEAGQLLLEHAQEGLESFRRGINEVRAGSQHEVINIATDFAFAAYWLVPRLPRFQQLYPDIDVSLVTSERNKSMLRADIDIAVIFGDGRFRHLESHLLFSEEAYPLGSPRLLEGRNGKLFTPAELASLPMLHLQPGVHTDWYTWNSLLAAWGIREAPSVAGLSFDNYTLLVQAAIAGRGIAIGWRYLTDTLLEQGLLARLTAESVSSHFGYHLILPERKRRIRLIEAFVQWIRQEAASAQSPASSGSITLTY
ncbi:LysR family transcriptional regulator [Pokkaliibacter plantistimulans]|uniref:LysR family transcriptional regulator n=1 Tax=Proteobacteria bacterium 228 TaxID=2083153 RepID=A0A2S5KW36_9PROT|nr:LysR substrate-binding domain-containing protein [Pokkaliibacter plantistimulans]PPC78486.1 LysR family transcriptional regulator [Pokkaliibacter plantistimulans]